MEMSQLQSGWWLTDEPATAGSFPYNDVIRKMAPPITGREEYASVDACALLGSRWGDSRFRSVLVCGIPTCSERFLLHRADRELYRMEAPPVTMMPVTGGTINMMEHLLQGSVLDQSLESLLHRLRGLCDNMEPETFLDHEMVFLLKGQQASPFVLRTRRSMDKPGAPWHLRYLGQPEMGDKNRHALVRNCVDIATSDNLTDFLVEMGFRMDHEFVAKGHVFRKGIMKIVVYKIFRILIPGNTDNIEPLSLSYLVELSIVAPAGQDMVSDDMRSFAEQLKPLVHLEKIDPKRLM
ncbi:mediator of RNA polymerase II transcription subunit 18 isoform 1-T1 [Vipera latastei]